MVYSCTVLLRRKYYGRLLAQKRSDIPSDAYINGAIPNLGDAAGLVIPKEV